MATVPAARVREKEYSPPPVNSDFYKIAGEHRGSLRAIYKDRARARAALVSFRTILRIDAITPTSASKRPCPVARGRIGSYAHSAACLRNSSEGCIGFTRSVGHRSLRHRARHVRAEHVTNWRLRIQLARPSASPRALFHCPIGKGVAILKIAAIRLQRRGDRAVFFG